MLINRKHIEISECKEHRRESYAKKAWRGDFRMEIFTWIFAWRYGRITYELLFAWSNGRVTYELLTSYLRITYELLTNMSYNTKLQISLQNSLNQFTTQLHNFEYY
jgi:hypothetical protein